MKNTTSEKNILPNTKNPTNGPIPISQGNPNRTPTTNTKLTPNRAPQPRSTAPRRRVPPPNHRDNHHGHHRRSERQFFTCKCCCLWLLFAILILLALFVLAAIPAAVFYMVYRPRPPTFSLSSLKITHLNLTQFSTKLNLTVTATNPNPKITFAYHPINVQVIAPQKKNVVIGEGSFPSFKHGRDDTITLFTIVKNNDDINVSDDALEKLSSDLKNKDGLDLEIKMDPMVKVEIGKNFHFDIFKLRVFCYDIKAIAIASKGKPTGTLVKSSNAECNVHMYIRIFEWDIPI